MWCTAVERDSVQNQQEGGDTQSQLNCMEIICVSEEEEGETARALCL